MPPPFGSGDFRSTSDGAFPHDKPRDLSSDRRVNSCNHYLWVRRDSAVSAETIVAEVEALMVERHPEWVGRDWIEKGVGCFCAEHA